MRANLALEVNTHLDKVGERSVKVGIGRLGLRP